MQKLLEVYVYTLLLLIRYTSAMHFSLEVVEVSIWLLAAHLQNWVSISLLLTSLQNILNIFLNCLKRELRL